MSTADPSSEHLAGLEFFELGPRRWVMAETPSSGEPDTRLECKVDDDGSIQIVAIHVHPAFRGQRVGLRMVRRVAERFPRRRIYLSAMNPLSRSLARRAVEIPLFDPKWEEQRAWEASDRAAGFYGDEHVDATEWWRASWRELGMPDGLFPESSRARWRWRRT